MSPGGATAPYQFQHVVCVSTGNLVGARVLVWCRSGGCLQRATDATMTPQVGFYTQLPLEATRRDANSCRCSHCSMQLQQQQQLLPLAYPRCWRLTLRGEEAVKEQEQERGKAEERERKRLSSGASEREGALHPQLKLQLPLLVAADALIAPRFVYCFYTVQQSRDAELQL